MRRRFAVAVVFAVAITITIPFSGFILPSTAVAQHEGNTTEETLAKPSNIIAAIAAAIAAIALYLSVFQIRINQKQFLKQMRANEKVNDAQFWLSLREFFSKYDEVHRNLRPGGVWSFEGTGPSTSEEWAKVEAYMGLFEHVNKMLDKELLDPQIFKDIYAYRLRNILSNQRIRETKLQREAKSWENFIDLCRKVGVWGQ